MILIFTIDASPISDISLLESLKILITPGLVTLKILVMPGLVPLKILVTPGLVTLLRLNWVSFFLFPELIH